ncbi:MAG: c-type cytochrome [Deltaproteobacteria bacterium]|nr:c-type cytochrome [Deltaproteobacteria bacterium]
MSYPFWDIPFGYGPLMGGLAIFHVFISHFAVGGGLYLVVVETIARKKNDTETLDFLEGLSKFFVLTTLVMGALTGVGIWFIIGLLNPAATEALIRHYVWAWAIEWTMFVVEIAAAILYFYGWKKMDPKAHLKLGWLYFGAAWGSLLVINGIITFMLTPGTWLETGSFWDGYFNPTFWPSLVFRTGIAITMAGLWSVMVLSRRKADDFKARAVRHTTAWGLLGLAITVPSFYWYWLAIPEAMRTTLVEQMPTPMMAFKMTYVLAAVLAGIFLVFGIALSRRFVFPIAAVAMVVGILSFGSFEWFRESARKPYVIGGYMYGNGIEVAKVETFQKEGMLTHIPYRTEDAGADLFRHACRHCHTLDGYKPLEPALGGMDTDFIAGVIKGTQVIKGNMPPFAGSEGEVQLLADYLARATDQRPLAEITGLSGKALGAEVYARRCGICHELGGFRDISESLVDSDAEELGALLDSAGEYAEEMPAFTGDDTERAALIEFLEALEPAAQEDAS